VALRIEQASDINKGKLVIDQDMTIYNINELKQGLTESLELYHHLELDLSAVEECDSSGIQLLIALRAEVLSKNKSISLLAISASVNKLMTTYGLCEGFTTGATL